MQIENPIEVKTAPLITVDLVIGENVLELLSDEKFLKDWDQLYHNCPWATVFQSKEFVSTWYNIYNKKYLPILVKAISGGELTGLLPLCRVKDGLIVGAGHGEAEYQVWISKVSDGESFIINALLEVRKKFPTGNIRFRFIPNKTPLGWTETNLMWKKCCVLRNFYQPLMTIDEVAISQELRKKNRREKINRLTRMGELKFERITDSQTFSSVFDELAAQFDFRKGAMFNKTPFYKSPLKKQFYLALFENGLLHTTILKLNEEIIASNVGTIGKAWVHLQGMNTHSPGFSKHSPGILHFLMMGKLLAEEGFEVFDLTPGGDSYKEGLATNHIMAYELRIAGSMLYSIESAVQKKVYDLIIIDKENTFNKLAKIGINPKDARKDLKKAVRKLSIIKERFQRAGHQGLRSLLNELLRLLIYRKINSNYKIYKQGTGASMCSCTTVHQDDLHDLLRYESKAGNLTKWEFLSDAMEKFEKGSHVYTISEGSCLLCSVWVKKQARNDVNKASKPTPTILDESVILYDIYYHPEGKDKLLAFITTAVYLTFGASKTNNLYFYANEKDTVLGRTLEKVGFIETREPVQ